MMARVARAYVVLLFVFELLLVGASVRMNLSFWVGGKRLAEQYGSLVFMGALLTAFPVAFLAKERNIWKNEFRGCPLWVRSGVIVLALYGIMAAFGQAILLPRSGETDETLVKVALPLLIDAIPLFILYAVLRSDWRRAEIAKRSGISFAIAIVCVVVFISNRAAYMAR